MFPLAFDAARQRAGAGRRADRRRAAGHLARDRQGRHVHGGRPGLRGARPRPHRRPRRRRARAADHRARVRRVGRGADGRGAERRLPGEEAAARRGRSVRAVVVDDRAAGRRRVHRRLCRARAGQRRCAARPNRWSPAKRVARSSELAALALSVSSLLLAFAALGPVPGDLITNPLAPKELATTLLVLLGGALLAFMLARSRWPDRARRRCRGGRIDPAPAVAGRVRIRGGRRLRAPLAVGEHRPARRWRCCSAGCSSQAAAG